MQIRGFRKADTARLREIHKAEGYGFKFPETRELFARFTVTDDDGRIVGFAGAELTAQIYGIFDSTWGSPHQRMEAIIKLHEPIRERLKAKQIIAAHVWLDPKWPKFGKRLSALGWAEALWRCFFREIG